jgi:Sec7-like guanine-nucleotide exchange factor
MNNDISEQYLDKFYDDIQKEQLRMMNDFKSGCDLAKEKDIQQQITLMNTLMMTAMRLRNKRKKSYLDA